MRRAQFPAAARSLSRVRGDNTILTADMSGAAAGSPGTLPTSWFDGANNAGTIARASVALSTQLGRPAIDVRVSGTPAGFGNYYIVIQPTVPAGVGQYFTNGVVVSLVGGSLTNISNFYTSFDEATSGNAYLTSSNGVNFTPTSTPQLVRCTDITVSGTIAKVYMTIGFVYPAAVATDVTFRISQPLFTPGRYGY